MFIGSFLPFISTSALLGGDIAPRGRSMTTVFGVVLMGLAIAAGRSSGRTFAGFGLAAALVGLLVYGSIVVQGFTGVESGLGSSFAWSFRTTYSPDIGIIAVLGGCTTVAFAATAVLNATPGRR